MCVGERERGEGKGGEDNVIVIIIVMYTCIRE